jgi:hypothetical protein
MGEPIGPMKKIAVPTAEEACARASLSGPARALLRPEASVGEFLGQLAKAELLTDSIALMAHALPKREAVWWACLAAKKIVDEKTPPEVRHALSAAEAWVHKPCEETRRPTMVHAQRTQFDHPAVWAAVAAFWSGGSMVAPELPAVAPAAHLTGLAVSGAVQLSVLTREPALASERFRVLLGQAIDIANGGPGRAIGDA